MLQTLMAGGWIMALIGLLSLAALTIAIERAIALRRSRVAAGPVLRLMDEYGPRTDPEKAIALCRRHSGPMARVAEECIQARRLAAPQITEIMHATGRAQISALERGMTILEIVAQVSPLLGLLGTVLGMITVFDAVTAEGIGNAQVLSAGIKQALITTVGGLTVAIPSLAAYSVLMKRVDDYATELHERATAFIVKLTAGTEARKHASDRT